jgi:hypothetical protein
MKTRQEGEIMNVNVTRDEIEEAVVLWLRQKHGLVITEKAAEAKGHFSVARWDYGQRPLNEPALLSLVITEVKGTAPAVEQPYR